MSVMLIYCMVEFPCPFLGVKVLIKSTSIKSTVLQLYIFMAVSYILSYHVQATPQLIIRWFI